MLRKNVKEILILYFLNVKQRQPLMIKDWVKKKESENINKEGRKEPSISKWNLFFENNKHTTDTAGQKQQKCNLVHNSGVYISTGRLMVMLCDPVALCLIFVCLVPILIKKFK